MFPIFLCRHEWHTWYLLLYPFGTDSLTLGSRGSRVRARLMVLFLEEELLFTGGAIAYSTAINMLASDFSIYWSFSVEQVSVTHISSIVPFNFNLKFRART